MTIFERRHNVRTPGKKVMSARPKSHKTYICHPRRTLIELFPKSGAILTILHKSQLKKFFLLYAVVVVTSLHEKNVNKTNERKPQNTHTQGGHPKERLKSLFTVRPTADHYCLWVLLENTQPVSAFPSDFTSMRNSSGHSQEG